jgi:hypothetical protein
MGPITTNHSSDTPYAKKTALPDHRQLKSYQSLAIFDQKINLMYLFLHFLIGAIYNNVNTRVIRGIDGHLNIVITFGSYKILSSPLSQLSFAQVFLSQEDKSYSKLFNFNNSNETKNFSLSENFSSLSSRKKTR